MPQRGREKMDKRRIGFPLTGAGLYGDHLQTANIADSPAPLRIRSKIRLICPAQPSDLRNLPA